LRRIDNLADDQTLAGHLNGVLATVTGAEIHVAYLRVSGVAVVRGECQEPFFDPQACLPSTRRLAAA
jgi:hypothetical protein